jgi:hypothetical protein
MRGAQIDRLEQVFLDGHIPMEASQLINLVMGLIAVAKCSELLPF